MTEPSSNLPMNIQPTKKLGGRGTPRRKTRRSNINPSLSAARALEPKLRTFRNQYQLQDQNELCDITVVYEDGRVELLNQVSLYSTWSMNIHQINASEQGVQTYQLNELDEQSQAYVLGETAPIYPSHSYSNHLGYQQNPYAYQSFENYYSNIRQVYGATNERSSSEHDEIEETQEVQSTETKSKRRRRRRRKPIETIATSIEAPLALAEDVNITPTNKRRRRRGKKSSKTGEQLNPEENPNNLSNENLTSSVKNINPSSLLSETTDLRDEEHVTHLTQTNNEEKQSSTSTSTNNSSSSPSTTTTTTSKQVTKVADSNSTNVSLPDKTNQETTFHRTRLSIPTVVIINEEFSSPGDESHAEQTLRNDLIKVIISVFCLSSVKHSLIIDEKTYRKM